MYALPLKRWTREEFARLIDNDFLGEDRRWELVDGQIVEKMTHKPPHVTAMTRIDTWLRTVIGPGQFVRVQCPIALDELSEPEPDLAVVKGQILEFEGKHPSAVDLDLLVEVSDTSLDRDRKVKAPLYSRAGVKELWILDPSARKLEMHREPGPNGYRAVTILAETELAAPLCAPSSSVRISDLLPTP